MADRAMTASRSATPSRIIADVQLLACPVAPPPIRATRRNSSAAQPGAIRAVAVGGADINAEVRTAPAMMVISVAGAILCAATMIPSTVPPAHAIPTWPVASTLAGVRAALTVLHLV